MSSAPLPSPLAALVLEHAGIFGLVTSFLCYGSHGPASALDNSLLHFAASCRRAYSLTAALMSDGPWWRQQQLCLDLRRPLLPLHEWCHLAVDDNTLCVKADGFGARQQTVLRRMMGDEAYERELAPRLSVASAVVSRMKVSDLHTGRLLGVHKYSLPDHSSADREEVDVYRGLTLSVFIALAFELDCLRSMFDWVPEPLRQLPMGWDTLHSPHSQWLLGCWDAALLAACTRSLTRASINLDMSHGLPQPYQTASLLYALSCLPAVTQLSLQWRGCYIGSEVQCHPAVPSLSDITQLLPGLTSLSITLLPLWPEFLHSLMSASSLQRLRLEQTPVYGMDSGAECNVQPAPSLHFSYPARWSDTATPSEQGADEAKARRKNCRLRVALCKWWEREVARVVEGLHVHWRDGPWRDEWVKTSAEARARAETELSEAGDGGDEEAEQAGNEW